MSIDPPQAEQIVDVVRAMQALAPRAAPPFKKLFGVYKAWGKTKLLENSYNKVPTSLPLRI